MLHAIVGSDGLGTTRLKHIIVEILGQVFPCPDCDDLCWHDKANMTVACLPAVWERVSGEHYTQEDLQLFLEGLGIPRKRPRLSTQVIPMVDDPAYSTGEAAAAPDMCLVPYASCSRDELVELLNGRDHEI
eukprot:8426546-Pyramimonas_sp.AAC.1